MENWPVSDSINQCFWFVEALVSESVIFGAVAPATCRSEVGVVVPMPTLPLTAKVVLAM